MALKSKEWFYKECLREVKEHGRFSYLCWNILEKGIGQSDHTRGHVTHSVGVAQQLLARNPSLAPVIREADPTRPFDVAGNPQVSTALKKLVSKKNNDFGKKSFGYSYKTFKSIMTPALGGKRKGGGGGNDEFKKVLRIMAEFIDKV